MATSHEFRIATSRSWFFLPNVGRSWTCECRPNGSHKCTPDTRSQYLFVPIATPAASGNARLRLSIYFRKNVVQSLHLAAQVSSTETTGRGYAATIDYSLSSDLDVSRLPARTANILTNQNPDSTHHLVVNGGQDEVLAIHLTDGQIRQGIDISRQALRNVHYREFGGAFGAEKQRENLLNLQNEKTPADFANDLKQLAQVGWNLWTLLLQGEERWWGVLRKPSSIQVSRTSGSTFVFPWALIYDLPLETGAQQGLCPLLNNWGQLSALVAQSAHTCPYETQHGQKNLLCPFGFWGFKHIVEQPPSLPKDRNLATAVQISSQPAELVAGLSLRLDAGETKQHLQNIRTALALPEFRLSDTDSVEGVRTALASPLAVAYFYCHGGHELQAGATEPSPYLQIGSLDEPPYRFFPTDIAAWRASGDWPPKHWHDASPLVFINGCHTVELTPEALVNFVDGFVMANAAGVIGTEIVVLQHLASEAAELFFGEFRTTGCTVGQALHQMRLKLLAKRNLLGLAYTAYCSADLELRFAN